MSSQWHAVEHHSVEVGQVGLQGLWMGYQAEAEGNVMFPGPMTTFLNKVARGRPKDKRTWTLQHRARPMFKTCLRHGS